MWSRGKVSHGMASTEPKERLREMGECGGHHEEATGVQNDVGEETALPTLDKCDSILKPETV